MSSEWHLVLEVSRVDLDDEAVVDALAPRPGLVMLSSSVGAVTTVDATIEASSADEALTLLLHAVTSTVPGAEIVRLVDPLVAVVDIADEAGVTRQAVQNWVTGARKAGFPPPLAVVGDGIRVWRLADVDVWLTDVVNLGTGRSHPSTLFVAEFNEGRWAPPGQEGGTPGVGVETDGAWHLTSASRKVYSSTPVAPSPQIGRPARRRSRA